MERMVGTLHELILYSIERYFENHNYTPSLEDIAKDVGTSKSVVKRHIERLFEEGYLETDEEKFTSRAWRLSNAKSRSE